MSGKKINGLFKVIVSLSGIVILSKLLGFAKSIVMASAFGATMETDIVTLAHTFISNIELVITGTLSTAFVPIYINIVKEGFAEKKKRFISNSIKLFVFVAICSIAVFLIGAPLISKIIAPSYDSFANSELTKYIRILTPVLISFVFMSLFKAVLNANEKFWPGELISVIGSVMMILSIVLFSSSIGTDTIILGLWGSSVVSAVFLGIVSRKHWTITRGNPFKDKDVIELLRITFPLLFGVAMHFINQQIDKIIVSGMKDGTVTAMNYSAIVSQFVTTLMGLVCMVLYTKLSVNSAQGEHKQNAEFVVNTLSVTITLLLPITILSVLCSKDIIRIIFERGAFDSRATTSASYALAGYGLVFIPFTMKTLFNNFLYSNKNTKSPTRNNIIGILFNIGLSLALYKPLGVFGVTFASSLSELLTGVLNIISAKKINEHISVKPLTDKLKYWISGSVLCIASTLCFLYVTSDWNSSILRFGCCAVIGFAVYLIPCCKIIKGIIKSLLNKGEPIDNK